MSDDTDRCRNCGCERWRRPFKRRDCCGKCFYLFEYLRVVERWDLSRPETLRQIGLMHRRIDGNPVASLQAMSAADLAVFKASYIGQIRAALDLLRIREAKRRGELRVDGSSIEHKLKDMLKLIQLRDKYERAASRFHGLATMLDHTFSPEQCRILYNLLDDIEEQTYGRVAEGYKALEAIYQNKRKAPVSSPSDAFVHQPHDIVRRVQQGGRVSLLGRIVRVPKRLRGRTSPSGPPGMTASSTSSCAARSSPRSTYAPSAATAAAFRRCALRASPPTTWPASAVATWCRRPRRSPHEP